MRYAVVKGTEPFPLDMLRRGRCWPRAARDTQTIASSRRPLEQTSTMNAHVHGSGNTTVQVSGAGNQVSLGRHQVTTPTQSEYVVVLVSEDGTQDLDWWDSYGWKVVGQGLHEGELEKLVGS